MWNDEIFPIYRKTSIIFFKKIIKLGVLLIIQFFFFTVLCDVQKKVGAFYEINCESRTTFLGD